MGFSLRLVAGAGEKWGPNQMHPDLKPESIHEQASAVDRALALALGARHIDVGQGPDAEHVVLGDPDGNEPCILQPGARSSAWCEEYPTNAWIGSGLSREIFA
ncbi:hypothetical protein I6N91_11785 [Arthrobacter sp. MSA 4-2]|uniref:VOC family protein n=1 Tax=Arthrobacter sp. MSA 4-2 TaxID=2794349 RepID=UPI0018E84714|nr:VOC family protein [Arthrobacter sp. MSA 4-2]MBJ2121658.1 hypothetical protein [Arthrobacter sp. MSA 4-2]